MGMLYKLLRVDSPVFDAFQFSPALLLLLCHALYRFWFNSDGLLGNDALVFCIHFCIMLLFIMRGLEGGRFCDGREASKG